MLTPEEESAITEYSAEFLEAARYGELSDLQLMFGHERLRQLIDFSSLVDQETETSPLMFASANGHLDCVQFLIESVQVEINRKNKSGNTALHWAALNGHAECVAYLISKGADVLASNSFGKTAFDEAIGRDQKECCELLVKEEVRLAEMEDAQGGQELENHS